MTHETKQLAMALLLGAAALAATAARAEQTGTFGETIDVRVVNVEAVVTDREGARVRGLGPHDFRLLVDGQEMPIEYFTEIRGGDAVAGAEGVQGVPAVTPGERLGTSYLVFIDELFTLATDRQRALTALAEQLSYLGPDDRMAIVAWDGRNVEMLSNWTGSVAELAAALDRAGQRPAHGLERLVERRQLVDTRGLAPLLRYDPYRLDIEERFYAELLAEQTERGAQAAAAALRGFGAPPGRRVMLLLSGGWPYSPTEFVAGNRLRTVFEPDIPDGRTIYRPLIEAANLLGYTLYPVDVPGMQTGSGVDAALAGPSVGRLDRDLDFYRENELHYTLERLADETGGRALINGARDRALEGAFEDTRSFYWLGFTPRWSEDDARHEIRVEVRNGELAARSRDGFADLSRDERVALAVQSAMLFGNPAADGSLTLAVGRSARAGWGKVEVPLTVTIPLSGLTLLPTAEGYEARLALHLAAQDESGATTDVPSIPLVIKLASAPAAGDSYTYQTSLKMRHRAHDLMVAVYDEAGGGLLAARAEIGL